MELVGVAAIAENGVIGEDGELPWPSVPEDKRQYRDRVADAPVILGRRTFESMREDPPGERQIVLSQDATRNYDGDVSVVDSTDRAIEDVRSRGENGAFVLGGGATYEAFFPRFDRLLLSRISGRYEGDTYFPQIDQEEWELVDAEPMDGFTLETWERT